MIISAITDECNLAQNRNVHLRHLKQDVILTAKIAKRSIPAASERRSATYFLSKVKQLLIRHDLIRDFIRKSHESSSSSAFIRNRKNKILNCSHPKIRWLVNSLIVVTEQKHKCPGHISPQNHEKLLYYAL